MRFTDWYQHVMDVSYTVPSALGCHWHWSPWDKYTHDTLCTKTISLCSSMRRLEKLAGGRRGLALLLPNFCFHDPGVSRSEKTKQQFLQRMVGMGEKKMSLPGVRGEDLSGSVQLGAHHCR